MNVLFAVGLEDCGKKGAKSTMVPMRGNTPPTARARIVWGRAAT